MTVEHLRETRIPMTWDDYEARTPDDDPRGEYFGGQLVVPSSPSRRHQRIVFELAQVLDRTAAPGTSAIPGWGWSPAGVREELIPDLMVHTDTEEDARLTLAPPLLVVEVLSSNRRTDLVEKAERYAAWGALDYWLVDPRERTLTHLTLGPGATRYRTASRLEAEDDVVVQAGYAGVVVELDLARLLR